jgi:hypothetical protein
MLFERDAEKRTAMSLRERRVRKNVSRIERVSGVTAANFLRVRQCYVFMA